MVFSSLSFLIFFSTLMVLLLATGYQKLPRLFGMTLRQWILLLASFVFYAAWDWRFCLLLGGNALAGWGVGMLMQRARNAGNEARVKQWLWLCLIFCLGTLGWFKYAGFMAESIENITGFFGATGQGTSWNLANIILPVGISFYTFQTLSYVVDLYYRKIPVCRNLPQFALFVAFFPQLVAGPIVRASDFLPQLQRRVVLTWHNAQLGAQLFLAGAVQKMLIADNLAPFVDGVYENPALYTAPTLWLAAVAYGLQIFGDFAGYSLMAIGIAKVLGYELPPNFNLPYVAKSIAEFWHRWHISLSSWLRDYLYIPLGGSRGSAWFTYRNLMITMTLGGLWHGASWNFVIWGVLHGMALAVHRVWSRNKHLPTSLGWLLTMAVVFMLWIPFRSPDFATTVTYFQGLFGLNGAVVHWFHAKTIIIIACVAVWHLFALYQPKRYAQFPFQNIWSVPKLVWLLGGVMAVALLSPLDSSPFIYFQF